MDRHDEVLEMLEGKLSQAEVARRLGISRDAVYRIVQKGRPNPQVAGRVVGVSTLTDADGNITAQWTKTRAEPRSLEDTVAEIKEALADFGVRAPDCPRAAATVTNLATVYICADWHLGMKSWGEETGANYDLRIADDLIRDAVGRLVDSAPRSAQAVVLGLGDLLHADGYDPLTAKSKNILDIDQRYPKILRAATRLMAHTVELALSKHDSVLVRILPGNHDRESAIAVTLALSMLYQENPRVTVDDDPGYFWFWPWGTTLLGATHGDQAKMAELPLIMATTVRKLWGKSRFAHIFTGHIHRQTAIEMNGVTVESFQTPAARDAWHAQNGYRANRSIIAIDYDKDRGELGRHRVNIL